MQAINLVMIENQEIIRNGIEHLLSDVSDIDIKAGASSIEESLQVVEQAGDCVVLLSLDLGTTLAGFIGDLLLENADAKVLVMNGNATQEQISRSMIGGAKGFVPSDISKEELIEAIRTVATGEFFFSRKVAHLITQDFIQKIQNPKADTAKGAASITHREMEILKLIAEGHNSQEIAVRLYISSRTVENHRANIMQKCRVKNAAHLVNWGYQNKILKVKS